MQYHLDCIIPEDFIWDHFRSSYTQNSSYTAVNKILIVEFKISMYHKHKGEDFIFVLNILNFVLVEISKIIINNKCLQVSIFIYLDI